MNNIVYIETSNRSGSGVLLKCECNLNYGADEESFIILTNYHVLQDIKDENKDQKKYIDLEILDVDGNIIDEKFITHIYFASGDNYDNASDIAALLIIVKSMCNVSYNNDVYFGNEHNTLISSAGYPYIFQDDTINRQLRIEGRVEKYTKAGIGIYKITDDYHWYTDVSDKKLLEGLSGAPVVQKLGDREYLIGINQSLCNIGEGKNPFKVVYFLNIKNVLEWLRSQNIILFEYYKRNVKIIWINQDKDFKENNSKEKHIVLLGSSGAGKTSLLKAMCLNGNKIDSSGDGQTTRSTITYHLERCCTQPRVIISFENKSEFAAHKLEQIQFRLIEYICCNRFGMKRKDIVADNMIYLRDLLLPMEYLKFFNDKGINKAVSRIKQTLYLCEDNDNIDDYVDKIIECYRIVFNSLEKYLKAQSRKNGQRNNLLNKFKHLFNKERYNEYIEKKGKTELELYYKDILSDETVLEDLSEDKDLEKEFKQIVNRCEGYFDIKEFFFLCENNEMEEECDKLFEDTFFENGSLITQWSSLENFDADTEEDYLPEENKKQQKNSKLYGRIQSYYNEIYECIRTYLHRTDVDIRKEKTIILDGISKKEMVFLARCMRKKDGDSLTAIIKNILVTDSFSNDYAVQLYEKGVQRVSFYDTYGSDHVDRGNQREVYFYNIFNGITDKIGKNIDAIFYVKKLDSGKPVELEKVIPVITKVQPAIPIYCIFTGADQFMVGKENYMDQLIWTKENYVNNIEFRDIIFPKAVSNLYENKSIVSQSKLPEKIKEKIYRFITDNLVPFSSIYKVSDDNNIELNRKSLDIIFTSLLIDEWNIGFIDKQEELNFDDELSRAVEKDLKCMFEAASEYKWEYKHHMTTTANFRRIYRYDEKYDQINPTLGFNRCQINRWNNRLQNGFAESFLPNGETYNYLIKVGITEQNAYSLLSRLRDVILLKGMSLWEEVPQAGEQQDQGKTRFREIFEKMYEMSGFYEVNIFERQDRESINKYRTVKQKAEFLNDVCNFRKGLDNPEIMKEFLEYMCSQINSMLQQENSRCFDLLYENNKAFRNSVETINKVIEKYSYGMSNGKSESAVNLLQILFQAAKMD